MRYLLRCFLTAMAVLLCTAAAAEGLICISADGLAVLMDREGNEIIPAGVFDDIFCVGQDKIYAVGSNVAGHVLYDLADADGALMTDISCEMFHHSGDVILFRRDGGYGAMDSEGRILLSPEYTQLVATGEGGYLALTTDPTDDEPDEILVINSLGEVLDTQVRTASGLESFGDGRMPFRSPDNERFGYLDAQGRIAIAPEMTYADGFVNGRAKASVNGLSGVLSPSGDWLVQPKYDHIEISGEVILGLMGDDTCVVWDADTCVELFRVEDRGLQAALVGDCPVLMDGEGVYMYGRDGTLLMQAGAKASLTVGAGDQLILSDGEWGTACVSVVDASGAVSAAKYQHLLPLDDAAYSFLSMNAVAYNSSILGEIRYSIDYDSIRYGMLNADGEEILPAEYSDILCVGEDRYLTVAGDGYRVVDGTGAVIWSMLEEDQPEN